MEEHTAQQVMRTLVDAGQLTDPDSARGKLLQTAAHLFRNKGFERTTVRERVLALIRCELQSIMGGSGEAMAVLVYEWRSLSAEGQAQVLALREVYETLWLRVLGEAKAAGYIKGDVFITRRLLTGALSWTTTWFGADGGLTLEQLAEQALLMVLNAD